MKALTRWWFIVLVVVFGDVSTSIARSFFGRTDLGYGVFCYDGSSGYAIDFDVVVDERVGSRLLFAIGPGFGNERNSALEE